MKENFKTEQDLSEERLQEITGGCGECITTLDKVANLQASAKGRIEASEAFSKHGQLSGPGKAYSHYNSAITLCRTGSTASERGSC